MITIKGVILGETDKAIQLKITEDEASELAGRTEWIPKSQSRIAGEAICLSLPKWLYDEKVKETKRVGSES